jgi:hypothetical protein
MKRTNLPHANIPGPYAQVLLMALDREKKARAIELYEAAGGVVPRDQVWMTVYRLRRKGVVRVVGKQECPNGIFPVYGITARGYKVLDALRILRSNYG